MQTPKTKLIFIIPGIIAIISLIIVIAGINSFLDDREFASGDLSNWEEVTGIVESSDITSETFEEHSRDSDTGTTEYYKEYNIQYTFVVGYEAWGRHNTFEGNDVSYGETADSVTEIPEAAYDVIPELGEEMQLIFDPNNDGDAKLGDKAHWESLGEIKASNLIAPILFGIVFLAMVAFMVYAIANRKRKVSMGDKE